MAEPFYSDEEYSRLREEATRLDTEHLPEWCRLLPSWFVPRMATDQWTFGLLLSTGALMVIESIEHLSIAADGGIWLEVQMSESPSLWTDNAKKSGFSTILTSPTERTTASINAAHIVAAFELAYT